MVTGFIISIVFQLAHAVEHTNFPLPAEPSGKIENEWAIHQVVTTANFATGNKLISWLVGGLNFQIEHHLFPSVSSRHARKVRDLVTARWPERYQSMPLVEALRRLHRTARVYKDATTLVAPLTGREYPTLLPAAR